MLASTHGLVDADLPWKIAFRVQFHAEKLGLRFHPAQFPDTGNGIYNIRLLELTKGPDGSGPAQHYNSALKPEQEHLKLRPGLYLTHINDSHLESVPCDVVIKRLQTDPRPVMLRFVDVEAGVVTPHELRDSLRLMPGAAIMTPEQAKVAEAVLHPSKSPKTSAVTAPEPTESGVPSPIYKVILLGTTGVGKSSILAVGVNGDSAYTERRATTLEAEFGTIEVPDPDISHSNKIRARIWDTAGQERYRAITRSHYRRADGALLVYDVADPESFDKLGEWLKTLRDTAGESLKCIMVVENKIDQLPEWTGKTKPGRPATYVQEATVQAFCKDQGLLFARTSAKMNAAAFKWEGRKVADVVSQLVLSIHMTTLARGANASGQAAIEASGTGDRVVLQDEPKKAKKNSSDCSGCGK
ncbi:TPA: hypothetical protein N0F65_007008 [Lagenidium giganteum]|uniref:Uncharacterized protein n=1 Tax=Lagenidium giganteum TaxID=4803 RepID=A0AAV2ZC37_9STRA|nr:TPA: hypothetical protein N0F65_007008 [Lagenidium giganteum]